MWVSGGATCGPPSSWIRSVRLMAYSSAWRTEVLPRAPPLRGDTVLKRTYGLVPYVGPRLRPGFLLDSKPGMLAVGTWASQPMSAEGLLVLSCCWMFSWLPVSVTVIWLT